MGQIGSSLYIKDTGSSKGRGVFTRERISAGTLIETSPVIVHDHRERELIDGTKLADYYFLWGTHKEQAAIVLGYGMMYNHSYTPNADYHRDLNNRVIKYVALVDILPGEEITINYNGSPTDQTPFLLE